MLDLQILMITIVVYAPQRATAFSHTRTISRRAAGRLSGKVSENGRKIVT
jgi:hypothetical protein